MPIGNNNMSNNVPPPIPRVNPSRPFTASYMPTTMLPGFYVNSDADISARDVPADGSVSFFPTRDLTHIVAKRWDGNTLESAVYVLQQPQQPQVAQQTQQAPLPPPPPPISQQQKEQPPQQAQQPESNNTEALLQAFTAMNEGIANAFGQFGSTLSAMQQSLEQISNRFNDTEVDGMG